MPTINITALGKGDPPPWPSGLPVIHSAQDWSMVVLEEGMQSGGPSVAVRVLTADGTVILETSLAALIAATAGLRAMAETRFGWEQPA